MNRKPGMTREEHFELGRQLHAAFEIVSAASVQIGNAYASNSRQARAASAVYRDMITLKAVMDDAICREGPLNVTTFIRAYYPRQEMTKGDSL